MIDNKQENEQFSKMNINWFPGHMTKAKREMQEKMKMVDLVIELRDARIPNASKNPMIEELTLNKPRLIILSKKDKADIEITKQWIHQLSNDTTQVLALNIVEENITPKVLKAVQTLMTSKIDRMKKRGIRPRAMRAMVVGVPNVGKSTFINKISKKKVAVTGNRPGVTKSLQWSKVNSELELLDTPGVLWPKFEDQMVGVLLGVTGAIRDEVLPLEEIAAWAMDFLVKNRGNVLRERYQIELCDNPYEMLERMAFKRGYVRNQEMDEKRTVETFLKEIRDDKLGPISWEIPHEM